MANLNLKGLWMPIEILTDKNLSDKEKHIYSLVIFLSQEKIYKMFFLALLTIKIYLLYFYGKTKNAVKLFLVFWGAGTPATLTLFSNSVKKCCSVLQYKVKMRGGKSSCSNYSSYYNNTLHFACINSYDSQAIAHYTSRKNRLKI